MIFPVDRNANDPRQTRPLLAVDETHVEVEYAGLRHEAQGEGVVESHLAALSVVNNASIPMSIGRGEDYRVVFIFQALQHVRTVASSVHEAVNTLKAEIPYIQHI